MPVVRVFLNEGDPTVQASGEHRGTVNAEFSDGRIVPRNLRAPDAATWSARMLDFENGIEKEVQEEDARSDIKDEEIQARGEATIAPRALAYLRAAMEQDEAYEVYKLMARFDNFREGRGWSWNQVVAGLMAEGLTEEEFDEMREVYTELSGRGRPAIMAEAKAIQEAWENR